MSAYLNVSVRIRKRHSFLQVDAAQCQDTQLCNGSMGQISAPLSLGQMSLCSEQPAQLYIAALSQILQNAIRGGGRVQLDVQRQASTF